MTDHQELLDILAAHFALVMDMSFAWDWHPVAPDVTARLTKNHRGRTQLHALIHGSNTHFVHMAWRKPRGGGSAYPHVVFTDLKPPPRPTKHDLFRQWLPYGKWTCADGREVLFSRGYRPIWERVTAGSQARRADPEERVPYMQQVWFYGDGDPPHYNKNTLARCLAVLKTFGATWEPLERFADVQRALAATSTHRRRLTTPK
jgi:crotonobetainyl-CoA:carnitine CoA-transferase CaiB-like acyl-CoA transferase